MAKHPFEQTVAPLAEGSLYPDYLVKTACEIQSLTLGYYETNKLTTPMTTLEQIYFDKSKFALIDFKTLIIYGDLIINKDKLYFDAVMDNYNVRITVDKKGNEYIKTVDLCELKFLNFQEINVWNKLPIQFRAHDHNGQKNAVLKSLHLEEKVDKNGVSEIKSTYSAANDKYIYTTTNFEFTTKNDKSNIKIQKNNQLIKGTTNVKGAPSTALLLEIDENTDKKSIIPAIQLTIEEMTNQAKKQHKLYM